MTLLIHERKKAEDLFLKDRKGIGLGVGEHDNEKNNFTGSEDTDNATSPDEQDNEKNNVTGSEDTGDTFANYDKAEEENDDDLLKRRKVM